MKSIIPYEGEGEAECESKEEGEFEWQCECECSSKGHCYSTVHCTLRCASREGESACCQQTDFKPCHILSFLQKKIIYFISEILS